MTAITKSIPNNVKVRKLTCKIRYDERETVIDSVGDDIVIDTTVTKDYNMFVDLGYKQDEVFVYEDTVCGGVFSCKRSNLLFK